MGPNSLMVAYVDPLGYHASRRREPCNGLGMVYLEGHGDLVSRLIPGKKMEATTGFRVFSLGS